MHEISHCMHVFCTTDLNMTCKCTVCSLLRMLPDSLSTGPRTLVSPVDPLVGWVEAVQVVASIQDSRTSCQLQCLRAQSACDVEERSCGVLNMGGV